MAKTTLVCGVPSIGSSGTPSATATNGFTISAGPTPGGTTGLLYFGLTGPAEIPFGTQGGLRCAADPLFRTLPTSGGGSMGMCNGQYDYTLEDLVNYNPGAVAAGSTIHAAFWFRDPASADGFGLSDALWFHVCP